MERTKFTPERGKVYTNQGGGEFRCLASNPDVVPCVASMQNVKSLWTFIAKGCGIYTDGTIDWDYSVGGHFQK